MRMHGGVWSQLFGLDNGPQPSDASSRFDEPLRHTATQLMPHGLSGGQDNSTLLKTKRTYLDNSTV